MNVGAWASPYRQGSALNATLISANQQMKKLSGYLTVLSGLTINPVTLPLPLNRWQQ
ncbi:TPA: hypothetical protein ACGJN9_001421 [Yersinia enterocolitica]